MTPRWMVERQCKSNDNEILQVIEVYKPSENKHLVNRENKKWTHKKELLLVK